MPQNRSGNCVTILLMRFPAVQSALLAITGVHDNAPIRDEL